MAQSITYYTVRERQKTFGFLVFLGVALNSLILILRTVQLYPYSPLMVHLKMMS